MVSLSLLDQRQFFVLRALLGTPRLICADEPTAGLEENDALLLLDLLRRISERCAVLHVSHNQRHVRHLGGRTLLLANGRILADHPTELFFSEDASEPARHFARTGGYPSDADDETDVPDEVIADDPRREDSQNAASAEEANTRGDEGAVVADAAMIDPAMIDPAMIDADMIDPAMIDAAADDAPAVVAPALTPAHLRAEAKRHVPPRDYRWLIPGRLGGMPRPGLMTVLEEDLLGLASLDVDILVTLEEDATLDPSVLSRYGIESVHFPIVDMEAPSLEQAYAFTEQVDHWLRDGKVVALHCRAGLGRTGTMLAAQLVWEGASSAEAVESARNVHSRWIQSETQLLFIEEFERSCPHHHEFPSPAVRRAADQKQRLRVLEGERDVT